VKPVAHIVVHVTYCLISVLSHVYCGVQSYPDGPRQVAVRRKWHVLFKGCNAVLGHLGSSLRASREAVIRGVTPLGKD